MTTRERLEEQLESVELLGDPVRRALYLHVAGQPSEVSRDQAAAAVRISRELAAFHLDKLVGARLLEPVYRRLTGRTGPGAGRPAKLYRRVKGDIEISLPQRDYQMASRIFARALRLAGRTSADAQLDSAARELGLEIGREAGSQAGSRPTQEQLQTALLEVLEAHGYQPFRDGARLRLANCPFHALALEFQQPVCGMNLAFLDGIRTGADAGRMQPELDPKDGFCCVSFRFPN